MKSSQPSSAALGLVDVYYPSSDGEPLAETESHLLAIFNALAGLRLFFRGRPDVYVISNMFLYYQEGDPGKRRSPDIMVVKGVDGRRKRRSFKTWEEKAVPRVVMEFTSKQTAAEDLGDKKELYRTLKVREYFLFDPLREYLPHPLMGSRLVRGAYQGLTADADGAQVSEELGLRLVPEVDQLGLYDVQTGEKLLSMEDAISRMNESRRELAETEQELEKERRRVAKLENELKRLRQARKRKKS
jgi:Uma2 family endonuclease